MIDEMYRALLKNNMTLQDIDDMDIFEYLRIINGGQESKAKGGKLTDANDIFNSL